MTLTGRQMAFPAAIAFCAVVLAAAADPMPTCEQWSSCKDCAQHNTNFGTSCVWWSESDGCQSNVFIADVPVYLGEKNAYGNEKNHHYGTCPVEKEVCDAQKNCSACTAEGCEWQTKRDTDVQICVPRCGVGDDNKFLKDAERKMYTCYGRHKDYPSTECPKIYEHVCDSVTSTTYDNTCEATCSNVDEKDLVDGMCKKDICACRHHPGMIFPVCGDGETYECRTEAECWGAKDIVDGECGAAECAGATLLVPSIFSRGDRCKWRVGGCADGCQVMDGECIDDYVGGRYGTCTQGVSPDAEVCSKASTCTDCTNAACMWEREDSRDYKKCVPSCTFNKVFGKIANCFDKAQYCPENSIPIAIEDIDIEKLLAGLKNLYLKSMSQSDGTFDFDGSTTRNLSKNIPPDGFDATKLIALFDESVLKSLAEHVDTVSAQGGASDDAVIYTSSVLRSSKELCSALESQGIDVSRLFTVYEPPLVLFGKTLPFSKHVCDSVTSTTYDNTCEATCSNVDEKDLVDGMCKKDVCACRHYGMIFPVCGDGETYECRTEAECWGAKDIVDGECGAAECAGATSMQRSKFIGDRCKWQVGGCDDGCRVMDGGCIDDSFGGRYGTCTQDASPDAEVCSKASTCTDCTNAACVWQKELDCEFSVCVWQKEVCAPSCKFNEFSDTLIANCFDKAQYCPENTAAIEDIDIENLLAGMKNILPDDFDETKLIALFDESVLKSLAGHAGEAGVSSDCKCGASTPLSEGEPLCEGQIMMDGVSWLELDYNSDQCAEIGCCHFNVNDGTCHYGSNDANFNSCGADSDFTVTYTASILRSSKELQSALKSQGIDVSALLTVDNGDDVGSSGVYPPFTAVGAVAAIAAIAATMV